MLNKKTNPLNFPLEALPTSHDDNISDSESERSASVYGLLNPLNLSIDPLNFPLGPLKLAPTPRLFLSDSEDEQSGKTIAAQTPPRTYTYRS